MTEFHGPETCGGTPVVKNGRVFCSKCGDGMKMDERKATIAIFQHVMHRLNEFFNKNKPEEFEGPAELGAAFFHFCGEADLRQAVKVEEQLRYLLWANHPCPDGSRYGDDGELQCSYCMLDFKRAPVAKIAERFVEFKLKKLLVKE